MKVTMRKGTEGYDKWIRIFGIRPVEVEPAGELDGKPRLRVLLAKLDDEQVRRWGRHVVVILKRPASQATKIAPTFDAADVDVDVEEELFP